MSEIKVNKIKSQQGAESIELASGGNVTFKDKTVTFQGNVTFKDTATFEKMPVIRRIRLRKTDNGTVTEGQNGNLSWQSQTKIDTDTFTHSTSSSNSQVTVKKAGLYHLICNVCYQNTVDSNRSTLEIRVRVNGTNNDQTTSYDYTRGNLYGDRGQCHISTYLNLSADDMLQIYFNGKDADGGIQLIGAECEWIMVYMGTST